jgi:hypothetical protein
MRVGTALPVYQFKPVRTPHLGGVFDLDCSNIWTKGPPQHTTSANQRNTAVEVDPSAGLNWTLGTEANNEGGRLKNPKGGPHHTAADVGVGHQRAFAIPAPHPGPIPSHRPNPLNGPQRRTSNEPVHMQPARHVGDTTPVHSTNTCSTNTRSTNSHSTTNRSSASPSRVSLNPPARNIDDTRHHPHPPARNIDDTRHHPHPPARNIDDTRHHPHHTMALCPTRPPVVHTAIGTSEVYSELHSLLQRETLASLYIGAMLIGFAVLGIVGGVDSQQQVFLCFSVFYGVFLPVVLLHCIFVVHRVWAVVPMLLYLVYAPVSVSLCIMHRSHLFLSISLVMVGGCCILAGAGGWVRAVSVVFMALFAWLCFGGLLNNPERGDVIALVVIPGIQMTYVCVSGVLSVLTMPMRTGPAHLQNGYCGVNTIGLY